MWRDQRPVLWERAWQAPYVAAALAAVRPLRVRQWRAEAQFAEDIAHELHDVEFRRLCALNGMEFETELAPAGAKRRRRA